MALNYLLSPEFQISVTSGKPDTGGWIEVFLAGTRTKYFTACDFDGTKNPFRVNLDSLGQAVMLAEDSAAYDVFVYNRYGSLLFSRYNVTPSNGGGISTASITSEDGSITVTQTEAGVDLSVNGHEASVLRATATPLTADGSFVFTRRQKTGESVDVGQQGNILAKTGWFHYDIAAELVWNSSNANQVSNVTLSSNVNSAVDAFDLSYPHSDFVQLSGEWKALEDNTVFSVSVTGIPQGMTVKISDFGIHAINGGGSGSGGSGGATYTGVDGIIVDNDNAEIKPDFDVVQHKLTEGSNISISGNEISANVPTKTSDLQNDSGYITSADIPAIPTKTSELQNDSGFITAASVPTKTSELQNDSGFITAASLPTVNDATLTIQKNGTTIDTFTANSSTNKTVNIAVPTKTSDLQNDSGFITSSDVPAQVQADWTQTNTQDPSYIQNKPQFASVAMTGSYADLSNTPTIPDVDQTYDASSANAQSGVAVAQALAGISVDEVPPVTSTDDGKVLTAEYSGGSGSYSWETPPNGLPASSVSDYGKVLTVNIAGAPTWATPESSDDVNPGRLVLSNNTMRIRFSDTSYDPTQQSYASASGIRSITLVSTGIYDFVFTDYGVDKRELFKGVFNDPNNIVDILAFYGDFVTSESMFEDCTSLRYIFNMRIYSGVADYMFQGCTGLREIHGVPPTVTETYTPSVAFQGSTNSAQWMFRYCSSLKIADIWIRGKESILNTSSNYNVYGMFSYCSSLEVGPAVSGRFGDMSGMFEMCSKLTTFQNTFTKNANYEDTLYGAVPPPGRVILSNMFQGCQSLRYLDGLLPSCWGTVSNLQYVFSDCLLLEQAPILYIENNAEFYYTYRNCRNLKEIPEHYNWENALAANGVFSGCLSLTSLSPLVGKLASSPNITSVSALAEGCHSVVDGALTLYSELSANTNITSHTNTFDRCGDWSYNNQLSSIPTSWGGTAT